MDKVIEDLWMKSNKGFTLIELLVVIAIIAMLLAILVPALRAVKIQAHMAVCLSNLNGLSKAYYAYTENNKGWLVDGNTPRYSTQGLDLKTLGVRLPYWVDVPQDETYHYRGEPDASYPTLEEKQLGIMRGALFDYVGNVDAYHCLGDLSKMMVPNPLNPYPENYSFRSYCVSGLMNGWIPDPQRKVKKMSEVINPGNKFALVETTDNRGWLMGSWDVYLDRTPPESDTLAIWHKERSGFGFADGHAEMHTWTDEYIIAAAAKLTTSVTTVQPFFKYTNPNSDDYKFIVRGYIPGRNIRTATTAP